MIRIAEPYARYASTVVDSNLDTAAEKLFVFSEEALQRYYADRYTQFGITVSVRIEIGSTRVWVTILATLQIFIYYGDIRQSVEFVKKDAQEIARHILPRVPETIGIPPQKPEYHERRTGVPGRLSRLFAKVESGELTADEATVMAIVLLKREGLKDEEVEVMQRLLSSEFKKSKSNASVEMEEQYLPELNQLVVGSSTNPRNLPSLPEQRDPVWVPPPTQSIRRRKGIIASRDPQTGDIKIQKY